MGVPHQLNKIKNNLYRLYLLVTNYFSNKYNVTHNSKHVCVTCILTNILRLNTREKNINFGV